MVTMIDHGTSSATFLLFDIKGFLNRRHVTTRFGQAFRQAFGKCENAGRSGHS
jgi:hypothetical protein